MSVDLPIIGNPPQGDNPWHPQCGLSIALRAEGVAGLPTLRVSVKPGKSRGPAQNALLEAFFGVNIAVHSEYDIILAWRCGCENTWEVLYRSVEDFPTTPGYHDACPVCGASPLEVVHL